MDSFQTVYVALRAEWRNLLPGAFERGVANALMYMIVMYCLVLVIEKAHGTRTQNYGSRDFAHDAAYYLYYRSGIHRFLFTSTLFTALDEPLAFLDLKLLSPLPVGFQILIGLLVRDCGNYWLHRAQHHFRFLWAFHSTHHSQERLTFASFLRFHPIEVLVGEFFTYLLLRALGFSVGTWMALFLLTTFIGEIQHSQIPWKLGPFYKVIVSPTFHAYHHSPDKEIHDRNYGGLFAFWDYLFGTAVPDGTPPPTTFGLKDVKSPTLWSTLVTPFRLLREFYGPGPGQLVRRE